MAAAKTNLLKPEDFAKKATWLDDGSLVYDITFNEDDIHKLPRWERPAAYFTLEAVLADACSSLEDRAETDQHMFIDEYFARQLAAGYALDWGGPLDDKAKNIVAFQVLRVVDRTCTLRAIIPLANVERWLVEVTYEHWAAALRKGDKLTNSQRNAIATIFEDYMHATSYTFWLDDYFALPEMQKYLDRAFDLMFHALRLPYVPVKWYKAQQKFAKARKARSAATEKARRAEEEKKGVN